MRLLVLFGLLCVGALFVSQAYAEDYDMDWRKYGPPLPESLRSHPLFARDFDLHLPKKSQRAARTSRQFRFANARTRAKGVDADELANYGTADKSDETVKGRLKKLAETLTVLEAKHDVFSDVGTHVAPVFFGEFMNLVEEDFVAAIEALKGLVKSLGPDGIKLVKEDKEPYLWRVLALLNFQNAGDPYYFVSHSAVHGIRTLDFVHKVYQSINAKDKTIFEKSGLSLANALTTALIHDCGYAASGALEGEKWPHALAGAKLIRHYMDFDTIQNKELSGEKHRNAIIHAVARHNFDKSYGDGPTDSYTPGCKYDFDKKKWVADWKKAGDDEVEAIHPKDDKVIKKYPVKKGKFHLFKKMTNDEAPTKCPWGYSETEGTLLKRDYTPADLVSDDPKDPNLFLLRMADNFDAQRRRLGKYQRSWRFMALLAGMYVSDAFRKETPARKKDALKTLKKDYFETAFAKKHIKHFSESKDDKEKKIVGALRDESWFNEESFLHFFSNYIIEKLDVKVETLDKKWDLTVHLHKEQDDEDPAKFANTLPFATFYQIWRAAEALKSLTVNKKTKLTDIIHITVMQGNAPLKTAGNNEIKEVPLRVFNPKAFKGGEKCSEDIVKFKDIFNYDHSRAPMFEELYMTTKPKENLMNEDKDTKKWVGEHAAARDLKC